MCRVGNPLELTLHIPVVVMNSSYVNSGKLIVIRASGGGAMTNTFGQYIFKFIFLVHNIILIESGEIVAFHLTKLLR